MKKEEHFDRYNFFYKAFGDYHNLFGCCLFVCVVVVVVVEQ